jgi:hypothetical protein
VTRRGSRSAIISPRRAHRAKGEHKKAEHKIVRRALKRRGKAARLARRLLDERPKALRARLGEMMALREPRRVKLS